MNVADALPNVTRLFLDTAPVIYFAEQNPHYYPIAKHFFDHIDHGDFEAVTSPVTLAEWWAPLVGVSAHALRNNPC